MIETNIYSKHLAGIIPVASPPLDFNMPWADCLMPVHKNYFAIERAINTAALAGCNTIWIVLHKEAQPLIRKKIGEWIYDPETIWNPRNVFLNKVEIPIYYIAINPVDRNRRDSQAWSALYGAKVSSYVSMKISKWVIPKKFFVVSPYGVIDDQIIKTSRASLMKDKNVCFSYNSKTFLDNTHLPFTFTQEEYKICSADFKQKYTGDETKKTFFEIFEKIDINQYETHSPEWFYNISNWDSYSKFLGSEHVNLCTRPKYMVKHEWYGLIKDR